MARVEGNDGIALRLITGSVRDFLTGQGEDPTKFGDLLGEGEVYVSGIVSRKILEHEEAWGDEVQLSLAANTGEEVPWTRWPYPTENDFSWSWDEMRGTELGQLLVDNGFDREGWADVMFIRQELLGAFQDENQIIASGNLRVGDEEVGVQWDIDENSLQICWNDPQLKWHSICLGFGEEGELESFDLEIDEEPVENEEKRRKIVTELLRKMKTMGRSSLIYDINAFTEEQLVAEGTLEVEELSGDEFSDPDQKNIAINWIDSGGGGDLGQAGREMISGGMRLSGIKGEGESYRIGQEDMKLLGAAVCWKIGLDPVIRDKYRYIKYWKEAGKFEEELREWGIWGKDWKEIIGVRDTLVLETMEKEGGVLAQVNYETELGEVEWQWDNEKSALKATWEREEEEHWMEFSFNVAGHLIDFDVYLGQELNWELKTKRMGEGLDIWRAVWNERLIAQVSVVTEDMISGSLGDGWEVEETSPEKEEQLESPKTIMTDTMLENVDRVGGILENLGINNEDWENVSYVVEESIKVAKVLDIRNYFEGSLYVGGREFWLEWDEDDGEFEISWLISESNECGLLVRFGENNELIWVEYCGTLEEDESGVNTELRKALEAIGEIRCGEYGININKQNGAVDTEQENEPEMGWVDPEIVEGLEIYKYDHLVIFDKNGRVISLNLN